MLQGLRVLVVEDEPLIAMTAEDILESLDCTVAGVAPTINDALEHVKTGGFDVAMLDVNMGGEVSTSVASALRDAGIPFVLTTGYGLHEIDAAHRDAPILAKPYAIADLQAALEKFAS